MQRPGRAPLPITLNLAGEHNVRNALAAIAVATQLDVADAAMQTALASFQGVGRRFERRGEWPSADGGRFLLLDDYGHHPVEMAAVLAAARGAFPGQRLVLAFQPHRYTRTRDCFEDFVRVLGAADAVLVREENPKDDAAKQFIEFDKGVDGYVAWLQGEKGVTQTVRLKFLLSVEQVSGESRLPLQTPRASGAELRLKVPTANAVVPGPLPLFPADNWWNTDISGAPVDPNSNAFIAFINNGGTRRLHPDFGGTASPGSVDIYGMPYAIVDGSQPKQAVTFDYWDESDGVNYSTGQGIPFYPIPVQAITQPHWVEGGAPGNVAGVILAGITGARLGAASGSVGAGDGSNGVGALRSPACPPQPSAVPTTTTP